MLFRSGLLDLITRLGDDTIRTIGHVEFTEEDVVRSEAVKVVLKMYT